MFHDYCPECSAYHGTGNHLPAFRVGIPDEHRVGIRHPDSEWGLATIHARDAEEAAEKYGEMSDEGGDHTIVGGSPLAVLVIDAQGKRSEWRVSGEARAVYYAEEVEPEDSMT